MIGVDRESKTPVVYNENSNKWISQSFLSFNRNSNEGSEAPTKLEYSNIVYSTDSGEVDYNIESEEDWINDSTNITKMSERYPDFSHY